MQGRAGEELGAELSKALERCLKAGPSGKGKHTPSTDANKLLMLAVLPGDQT